MLYKIIDMSSWKTKSILLKEYEDKTGVLLSERTFRQKIKENNSLFYKRKNDVFIAHSSKGYIATTNEKIIRQSIADNRKRALNLLYDESQAKKTLNEKCNFRLEIDSEGNLYYE